MRRAGYTDVATSLSLVSLARKGLIDCKQIQGDSEDVFHTYPAYALTAEGLEWMLQNQHLFKLRADDDAPQVSDEDIPF
jgi:hypothetical protein